MKKLSIVTLSFLFLVISCQKNESSESPKKDAEEMPVIAERRCAAHEVLEEQMAADPALRTRMNEIEAFTRKAIESGATARIVNGVIEISVVVHVLYRTAAENISLAQIQSQIDVLNEDFNNTNADRTDVPFHFQDEQDTIGIKFVLKRIIRKPTKRRSWGTDDAVKKTSLGGSDPIDPLTTLNMWVCNLGQGLLGYAQFPGGNSATDGVVCLYSAFGSAAKASGTYIANYNLGRTATHEVGHYLNLRHIWGDATCGSDGVNDTPQHNTSNSGCPSLDHKSTCLGTPLEMWMNYMDYTYDACMYMFTNGQKLRIDAVFAEGGPRRAMAL